MNEDGCACMCKNKSLLVRVVLVKSIKTPAVRVRCGLTNQSTMFSHLGISALLSLNFTGNVLSKFIVCLFPI